MTDRRTSIIGRRLDIAVAILIGAVLALGTASAAKGGDDDPDTEVAKRYFKQGSDLYVKGEYEKALAAFERAKTAKSLAAFDFNIALCYDRMGRWAEALAAYERFAVTSSNPAHIKEAQQRIPVLRERLKVTSNRAAADEHYRKAVVQFNNGAYGQAAAEFKLAYEAVPEPLYLYSAAQAYRLSNDKANALKHYQEFLKVAPNSPQRVAVELRIKELKGGGGAVKPGDTSAGAASERLKAVAEIIKGKRPGFRACFDDWSSKHPGVGGQVDLSFFLDPDGMIQQAEAQTKGFESPEVASCIVKFAHTLSYPPAPNGKYTRFRYPFDFKPN